MAKKNLWLEPLPLPKNRDFGLENIGITHGAAFRAARGKFGKLPESVIGVAHVGARWNELVSELERWHEFGKSREMASNIGVNGAKIAPI